jgi:hypothetical protein
MVRFAIDFVPTDLDTLEKFLEPIVMHSVVGASASELVKEHLAARGRAKHRGTSTLSFYQRASDATISESNAKEAVVTIDHFGLALRRYGGLVRPTGNPSKITGRPITTLAIPIEGTEGERKALRRFKDIFFVLSKKGKSLLVSKQYGPVFVLVKGATHLPDESVLPSRDSIVKQAEEALQIYLEERLRKHHGK